MGLEIIALIVALLGLIPVVISAMSRRKANRNALGRVESAELLAGMDRVDRITGVQPVPKQD